MSVTPVVLPMSVQSAMGSRYEAWLVAIQPIAVFLPPISLAIRAAVDRATLP